MSKICQITGKKTITGNNVSHAKNRVKRKFYPNLFKKKVYLEDENKWVSINVSAKGLRIIAKKGVSLAIKESSKKGYINLKNLLK